MVCYHDHKGLPLALIRSRNNPLCAPSSISLRSILLLYSHWHFSFRFLHQHPLCTSLCQLWHIPHPSHSSWFHHSNNNWWGVQIMRLLTLQFPPIPSSSSLLSPNIFLSTQFSDNFSLCYSFLCTNLITNHTIWISYRTTVLISEFLFENKIPKAVWWNSWIISNSFIVLPGGTGPDVGITKVPSVFWTFCLRKTDTLTLWPCKKLSRLFLKVCSSPIVRWA